MSIDKNKNSFAVFGLLFGAVTWGIIWYPYRLLEQAGFTGISSSLFTYAITMVIGCLFFIKQWHSGVLVQKNIIWLMLAAGWTNLSYVLAVIDGEVVRVMLLFYLSPVWTLLIAHFWLKERVGIKGFMVIATSLLGAFVMLYDPNRSSNLPLPHNTSEWLALSSGIGFALANGITRKSDHLSLQAKSLSVWLGVVLMALVSTVLLDGSFRLPDAFLMTDWLIIFFVSLMLFASTLLVQYGLTHTAAVRASIIFLFELVIAAVAAYYLANEMMTMREWGGGLLIIAAAIYAAIYQS